MQLADFIVDCQAESTETCDCLKTFQRFNCLATYLTYKQKWEEAFGIWDRLLKSDIEDAHFLGCSHVAEQLIKYEIWCSVSLVNNF